MAHESFEDREIAEYLNTNFISIKVDREERPDVDSVYMSVCMSLTGDGGWPLSIFMSPDQKPFYAGTYFPKYSLYQRPGFLDLLRAVKNAWKNSRDELIKSGEDITKALKEQESKKGTANVQELIQNGENYLRRYFDKENAGFGRAPKFPTPHNLIFLLKYAYYYKDNNALEMAEKTLISLYRGGIFDHIGYGFSRYSTDSVYLVPHFEKMLYDNALLTIAYLECYQCTKVTHYREIAEKIMEYVKKELTEASGGFYCAQDADSEGKEGKYYVFFPEEAIKILGEEDGRYFNEYFDITKEGNFEGANIPNRIKAVKQSGLQSIKNDRIDGLCRKMYDYRLTRMKLHKDDKILTSWSSLMIAAYAHAYRILGEEKYLEEAVRGVQFIKKHLTEGERLKVLYRDGVSKGEGHLEDYAFYCLALLYLYEGSFEAEFLKEALYYAKIMLELFFDTEEGGFYLYAKDAESLLFRPKTAEDNAMPSGNSAAALVLQRLALLTGDASMEKACNLQLNYLSEVIDYPVSHCFTLSVMLSEINPSRELVCVSVSKDIKELQKILREHYLPDMTVIVKNGENEKLLGELIPFTREYPVEEKDAYYLCEDKKCQKPVYNIEELKSLLRIPVII
ncbi:thioredoxin domain-containing protein [Anaerocolumna xylanovorans]|nr:thioredoxin domain-containing protein [Anaerocolumna xylanovorans]